MGGQRVTPETEKTIIMAWAHLKKKNEGNNPIAKEVLRLAEDHAKRKNLSSFFAPSIRTVQNIIRQAEDRHLHLSKNEKVMQEPWSMAKLESESLHGESIPSVLQAWRYSLAIDKEYTVRQAKWVSRLYRVIPNIVELWLKSHYYAVEEELAVLSGKPSDSFDSTLQDLLIAAGNFERHILLHSTEAMKPSGGRHDFLPVSQDGGIDEELIITQPKDLYEQTEDEINYHHKLGFALHDLPSSTKYFASLEPRLIYLRLFSYFSRSEEWDKMSSEKTQETIVSLREWVSGWYRKFEEDNMPKDLYGFPAFPQPEFFYEKFGLFIESKKEAHK